MREYTGKGVYGAIAVGKISIFKKQDTVIQRTSVTDTEAEKARAEAQAALAEAKRLKEEAAKAVQAAGERNE